MNIFENIQNRQEYVREVEELATRFYSGTANEKERNEFFKLYEDVKLTKNETDVIIRIRRKYY